MSNVNTRKPAVCGSRPSAVERIEASGCTDDLVRAALRRYFRDGHEDLDAKDPAHVAAYKVLRQTQTRVCPFKLLQYLQCHQKDLKHGSVDAVEFWGVPIENFPNGLPSDIGDCRMTEEDMEKYELLGDTKCDMERYYIIDQQAKRHVLGKEVHIFKFFLAGVTSVRTRQPSAAREPSLTAGQPSAARAQPREATPLAMSTRATVRQRAVTDAALQYVPGKWENLNLLKRHASSDDEPLEDPPRVKRRKMLSDTMAHLRGAISEAAANKKWNSDSEWNRSTVTHYGGEMLSAMGELTTEDLSPGQSIALIDKASAFIANQIQQHASIADLRLMQSILAKIASMNATQTPLIKILTKLALLDPADDNYVSFLDIDVVERNLFWKTQLWQSYCDEKFKLLVDKAKAQLAIELRQQQAADGQPSAASGQPLAACGSWIDHMKAALQISPVSAGLVEMAETVLAVFGPSQPSAASIEAFMQQQAPVLKLMRAFAPNHQVTFVCELLSETTRRFKCWEWLAAADWICTADINLEQHPVLDACVRLYSEAINFSGHSAFVSNLVCKLVHMRMPLTLQSEMHLFDPQDYLETHRCDDIDGELEVVTSDFMGLLRSLINQFTSTMPQQKKSTPPDWLMDFKLYLKNALKPQPTIYGEGITAAATPLPTPAAADATAGAGVAGTDGAAAVAPLPAVGGAEPAVGGTVLAVCDTEPAVDGTAPGVDGTITSGTPPATSGGRRQAIIPSGGVHIGQELIGHAFRKKDMYDKKRCRVVRILTNDYVVEMLEGPKEGEQWKYRHDNISWIPRIEKSADIAETVDGADSDATIAADGLLGEDQSAAPNQGASTTMNLEDIWGAF
jgi:hypothetical protein